MKIIDCNKNEELATELTRLLEKYSVVKENDRIYVTKEITASVIESLLKETGRSKHRAFLIDYDKFIVTIPQDLRDIGMDSCEFCGYVGYIEDVDIHRRSHQAL